ncbi:MAG: hypothetical protein M1829_003989 [Trizodia sp. TS-e1964]|nr:MAG: hypothetical protein M1829_003989 [Trizodia sp. TS-e1964]
MNTHKTSSSDLFPFDLHENPEKIVMSSDTSNPNKIRLECSGIVVEDLARDPNDGICGLTKLHELRVNQDITDKADLAALEQGPFPPSKYEFVRQWSKTMSTNQRRTLEFQRTGIKEEFKEREDTDYHVDLDSDATYLLNASYHSANYEGTAIKTEAQPEELSEVSPISNIPRADHLLEMMELSPDNPIRDNPTIDNGPELVFPILSEPSFNSIHDRDRVMQSIEDLCVYPQNKRHAERSEGSSHRNLLKQQNSYNSFTRMKASLVPSRGRSSNRENFGRKRKTRSSSPLRCEEVDRNRDCRAATNRQEPAYGDRSRRLGRDKRQRQARNNCDQEDESFVGLPHSKTKPLFVSDYDNIGTGAPENDRESIRKQEGSAGGLLNVNRRSVTPMEIRLGSSTKPEPEFECSYEGREYYEGGGQAEGSLKRSFSFSLTPARFQRGPGSLAAVSKGSMQSWGPVQQDYEEVLSQSDSEMPDAEQPDNEQPEGLIASGNIKSTPLGPSFFRGSKTPPEMHQRECYTPGKSRVSGRWYQDYLSPSKAGESTQARCHQRIPQLDGVDDDEEYLPKNEGLKRKKSSRMLNLGTSLNESALYVSPPALPRDRIIAEPRRKRPLGFWSNNSMEIGSGLETIAEENIVSETGITSFQSVQRKAALRMASQKIMAYLKDMQKEEGDKRARIQTYKEETRFATESKLIPTNLKEVWEKDLMLRELKERLEEKLRGRYVFILQQMPRCKDNSKFSKCGHPFCRSPKGRTPGFSYRISVEPEWNLEFTFLPNETDGRAGNGEDKPDAEWFCLTCLEDLWNTVSQLVLVQGSAIRGAQAPAEENGVKKLSAFQKVSSKISPETREDPSKYYTLPNVHKALLAKWKRVNARRMMFEMPNPDHRAMVYQLTGQSPTEWDSLLDTEPVGLGVMEVGGAIVDIPGAQLVGKELSEVMRVVDDIVSQEWEKLGHVVPDFNPEKKMKKRQTIINLRVKPLGADKEVEEKESDEDDDIDSSSSSGWSEGEGRGEVTF